MHLHLTDQLQTRVSCLQAGHLLKMPGAGPGRHCPLCQANEHDTEPRFTLSDRSYECFGCGAKGNAIELVQLMRHCTFDEARQWLEQQLRPQHIACDYKTSNEINEAFLQACRPIPQYVQQLLQRWSISPTVSREMRLRYYTHDYPSVLLRLVECYGQPAMKAAGLVGDLKSWGPLSTKALTAASCFGPYVEASVPYLIIPFLPAAPNGVLHLKARALVNHARLSQLKLPPVISSLTPAPALYNHAALDGGSQVFLFRRDIDVLVAQSLGLHAVACSSWTQFGPAQAKLFFGKETVVVLDETSSDHPLISAREAFRKAGMPIPKVLRLPPLDDLADILRQYIAKTGGSAMMMPPRTQGQTTRAVGHTDIAHNQPIKKRA